MVVRLRDGPRSPEDYDKYVSARLPPGPPRGDNSKPGAPCFVDKCRCREGYSPDEYDADCDEVLWHGVLKQMVHLCEDDSPCRDSSTGRYVGAPVHCCRQPILCMMLFPACSAWP